MDDLLHHHLKTLLRQFVYIGAMVKQRPTGYISRIQRRAVFLEIRFSHSPIVSDRAVVLRNLPFGDVVVSAEDIVDAVFPAPSIRGAPIRLHRFSQMTKSMKFDKIFSNQSERGGGKQ